MRFRFRGVTSLLLALTAIVVAVSGVVLYIGPRGRVADWTGWTLLGITKDAWEELHIIMSLLIIPIALTHWFLNWSTFWAYLKKKTGGLNLWAETAVVCLLVAVIMVGTLMLVPPFNSVFSLGSYFQNCWEQSFPAPPVAYAEKFPLDEFAETIGLEVDEMVSALEQEGLEVDDPTMTVEDFALGHGVKPPDVLAAIQRHYPQAGTGESEFD